MYIIVCTNGDLYTPGLGGRDSYCFSRNIAACRRLFYPPSGLMVSQGLAMPFPLCVNVLSQMRRRGGGDLSSASMKYPFASESLHTAVQGASPSCRP